MADRDLNIRLLLEGSALDLQKALGEASKSLGTFKSDVGSAERAMEGFTLSTRKARDDLRDLSVDVGYAQRAMGSLTRATRELRDGLQDQAKAARESTASLIGLNESSKVLRDKQLEMAAATEAATSRLKDERDAAVETAVALDAVAKKSDNVSRSSSRPSAFGSGSSINRDSRNTEREMRAEMNRIENLRRAEEARNQAQSDRTMRQFLSGLLPGGGRATGVAGGAGVAAAATLGAPVIAPAIGDIGAGAAGLMDQIVPLVGVLPSLGEGAVSAGQGLYVLKQSLGGMSKVIDASTPTQLRSALQGLSHDSQLAALHMRKELLPALNDLSNAATSKAQPALFNLAGAFASLAEHSLKPGIAAASGSIAQIAESLGKLFRDPAFQKGMESLTVATGKGLSDLSVILPRLLDAATRVMNLASPNTDAFGGMFKNWSVDIDNFVRTHAPQIQQFLAETSVVVHNWLTDLGSIARMFYGIYQAALPVSNIIGSSIVSGLREAATWINSAGGQNALGTFFRNALPPLASFAHLIGDLGGDLAKLAAMPASQDALKTIFDVLRVDVLPVVNELVSQLPPLFEVLKPLLESLGNLLRAVGPSLAAIIGGVTNALRPLVAELSTVVNGLTAIVHVIGPGGLAGVASIGGAELLQRRAEAGSNLGKKVVADMTGADLVALMSGGGAAAAILGGGGVGSAGASIASDPLQRLLRSPGGTRSRMPTMLEALLTGGFLGGGARNLPGGSIIGRAAGPLTKAEAELMASAESSISRIGTTLGSGRTLGGLPSLTGLGGLGKLFGASDAVKEGTIGAIAAGTTHLGKLMSTLLPLLKKGGALDAVISGLGAIADLANGKTFGASIGNAVQSFLSPLSIFGSTAKAGGAISGIPTSLGKHGGFFSPLGDVPSVAGQEASALGSLDFGKLGNLLQDKMPDQPVRNFADSLDKMGLSGKRAFDILRNMPLGQLQALQDHATVLATQFPQDAKGLDQFWHSLRAAEDPMIRSTQLSDQLKTRFIANFQAAEQQSGPVLTNIAQAVKLNMEEIKVDMDVNSAKGKRAISLNFQEAASMIHQQIGEGVVDTGKGMQAIRRLMIEALRALGSKSKVSDFGNASFADLQSYTQFFQNGEAGTISKPGTGAASGFVGDPRAAGADRHLLMVGEGEAVLNRHQRAYIDARLASHGESVFDVVNRRVRRPHNAATGFAPSNSSGIALPLPDGSYFNSPGIDQGVDYPAPGHTPEYAMGAGRITATGIQGFGPWAPVLGVTQGPLTGRNIYYGHAGPNFVNRGDNVGLGQQISQVADPTVGLSTGPHIELGFSDAQGNPTNEGAAMNALVQAIRSGKQLGAPQIAALGAGAPGGSIMKAMRINAPRSHMGGVLGSVVQAALDMATRAANASLAGAGGASGTPAGVPFTGGGGRFLATAYGPPWDAMEGSGVTSTGIVLPHDPTGRAGPYIIATDPSVIPTHSKVKVWPNPFGYTGAFQAEDTGGAIKGHHLDFLDMMGRSHQNQWGSRQVDVMRAALGYAARRAPSQGIGNSAPYIRLHHTLRPHHGQHVSSKSTKTGAAIKKHRPPRGKIPRLKGIKNLHTLAGGQLADYIYKNAGIANVIGQFENDYNYLTGTLGAIDDADANGKAVFAPQYATPDNPTGYVTPWKIDQEIAQRNNILKYEMTELEGLPGEIGRIDSGGRNANGTNWMGASHLVKNVLGFTRDWKVNKSNIAKWTAYQQHIKLRRLKDSPEWVAKRKAIRDKFAAERHAIQAGATNGQFSKSQSTARLVASLTNQEQAEVQALRGPMSDGTYLDPVTVSNESTSIHAEFRTRIASIRSREQAIKHGDTLNKSAALFLLGAQEQDDLFNVTKQQDANRFHYAVINQALTNSIGRARKSMGVERQDITDDLDAVNGADSSLINNSVTKAVFPIIGAYTPSSGTDIKSGLIGRQGELANSARTEANVTIATLRKDWNDFFAQLGVQNPAPAATVDTDKLRLQTALAQNALSQLSAVSGQFGVLQGFAGALAGRAMGSFAKGGVIPETGMYLMHKHETIIPDPQGPYKHAAQGYAAAPTVNVEHHLYGDMSGFVRHFETYIDGRVQKVVSEQTGAKSRRIRNAPGGR